MPDSGGPAGALLDVDGTLVDTNHLHVLAWWRALRRFVERIRPRYLIHGHVHLNYGYGDQRPLQHGATTIINTCGYRVLEIEPQRALALEAGR